MTTLPIKKISVVMSVFNCARFVDISINSILSQTYQDFEFIIIDDGSTDGTDKIICSYASNPKIRILTHENWGLAASLNHAISFANGEFIARQDADDISHPQRFEHQLQTLEKSSTLSLLGCWSEWFEENGDFLRVFNYPTENKELQELLLEKCCFTHGSVMMRKSAFDSVGGYCEDFTLAQDYDLWLRIAEKYEIGNLPLVLYKYRKTLSGISYRMHEPREKYKKLAQQRAHERRNLQPQQELSHKTE